MKKLSLVLIILLLSSVALEAQNATIWGPGSNYEIDFLHSGSYTTNNQTYVEFENEATTEFKMENVTNEGYDYRYLGYQSTGVTGSIRMRGINFGNLATLYLPTGDMPVMLPLSYGEEDDWIVSFSEKINELSKLRNDEFYNLNSSTDSEYMYLKFATSTNGNVSVEDSFFSLPQLQPEIFEGKNNTYVNSTIYGDLSYQLSTGVLFFLNITVSAEQLLVDSTSFGELNSHQQLDFVAVIPPASIISAIDVNVVFFVMIGVLVIFRNQLRKL